MTVKVSDISLGSSHCLAFSRVLRVSCARVGFCSQASMCIWEISGLSPASWHAAAERIPVPLPGSRSVIDGRLRGNWLAMSRAIRGGVK